MANRGDKVVFRSVNDGQDHDGTVLEVADSPAVREQFGDSVLRIEASETRRGWEIVAGSDVRPAD
jgi:hypothetical protein